MSKTLIKNLSIWGAVFAIVAGSLLHFTYGWSAINRQLNAMERNYPPSLGLFRGN